VAAAAGQGTGCGSQAAAWRRLNQWAKAGVVGQLHLDILDRLGEQGRWTGRAPAWTRPACGQGAGGHVGANPVDRGKPGFKIQLVCEGTGYR
jgi:hypothetical protein